MPGRRPTRTGRCLRTRRTRATAAPRTTQGARNGAKSTARNRRSDTSAQTCPGRERFHRSSRTELTEHPMRRHNHCAPYDRGRSATVAVGDSYGAATRSPSPCASYRGCVPGPAPPRTPPGSSASHPTLSATVEAGVCRIRWRYRPVITGGHRCFGRPQAISVDGGGRGGYDPRMITALDGFRLFRRTLGWAWTVIAVHARLRLACSLA